MNETSSILGFVDRNGVSILNDKSNSILPSHLLMNHCYEDSKSWFLNKCSYIETIAGIEVIEHEGKTEKRVLLSKGKFKADIPEFVDRLISFHELTRFERQWQTKGEPITTGMIKNFISFGLSPFGLDTRAIKEAYELLSIRCESADKGSSVPDLITYDADYFNNNDIPEPEPIISMILYPGLGMLGAPAKMGKTYMCLQLSCCVATGQPFMGFDVLRPGPVLYLDLQGTRARTKKRLHDIGYGKAPKGLMVTYEARATDTGLISQLEKWISSCSESPSLIIIDMFEQVKGSQRKTEDSYRADNRILEPLHDLALRHNICVLVVMHTRKGNKILPDDDPFNEIIGSVAQFGTADCAWMIIGKRNAERVRFSVICRDCDIGQMDYEATFKNHHWDIIGTVEDCAEDRAVTRYNQDPVVFTIKKLVEESPTGWIGTMSDLIQQVAKRTSEYPASSGRRMRSLLDQIEYRLNRDGIQIDYLDKNGGENGRRCKIYRRKPEQKLFE